VADVDLNYDAAWRKRMALLCAACGKSVHSQLEILRLATQVVERSLADDSAERPAVTVVSMKPTSS
jgi:hypothetical protein